MTRPGPAIVRPSILAVDDRLENLEALRALLEPLDCDLVTATSGREALRLLLEGQFAVILLDVQMPDMDGFETASYIRDRDRTRRIPIIFLSAVSTNAEHVFRGYEAGAVDYIVKPIDPVAIRSKVRVFVELYERGEQIRRQAETLRRRELEQAREHAEHLRQRRRSLLNAVAAALERRTETAGRAQALARFCVPELADLALVEVAADPGGSVRASVASSSRALERGLRERLARHTPPPGAVTAPRRAEELTETVWLELVPGALGEAVWERVSPSSAIVVPLELQPRYLGRLVLVRGNDAAAYGEDDLEVAVEVAKRAAMALETSRLYELERDRSRTLQLSLLGETAIAHPVVTIASRYIPGAADLEVGGDWCDLVERDDGRFMAVVGDVVGRGIHAAAAMGKLRSAIGALALVIDDPAVLLERLDQFAARIPDADLATVICALIDPEAGTIAHSSAGHLPALLVRAEGDSSFLEGGRGYPLGVDRSARRQSVRADFPVGATLVLFTDGLVESPSRSIDQGLSALSAAACERALAEPECLCDELVAELVDGPNDDVALVCLRFVPQPDEVEIWRFPGTSSQISALRHALDRWLEEREVPVGARGDLALALSEACSNAVRHAYRERDGDVTVQLRRHGGQLTLRVSDAGRWSDRREAGEGGWGLEIISALVDDAHVHGTPYGTTVIMRKHIQALEVHVPRGRRRSSRSLASATPGHPTPPR